MRIPRIHVDAELSPGLELALEAGAARHVVRVLRLQVGQALILFDGRGGDYRATITAAARDDVRVQVGIHEDSECESPVDIVLVQGISRGDRMDYAVQKAVELGVSRVVPVIAERSVVQLKGERAERRRSHWQRVAVGACEQCGRNRIPRVEEPIGLNRWLAQWPGGSGLLLSPRAESTLRTLSPPEGTVTLLIGPEGGLTEGEERQAVARGFTGVRLGPRILRTETAAVAMLAALQTWWGDFAAPEQG